jgi:hypothetical protein
MPVDIDPKYLDAIPLKGIGPEHLRDRLILPAHLSSSSFGLVGSISTIDPDDAAAAGSTGLIADAGHQHRFTTAAPSALTKTTTNTEGSGTDFVRNDHGHSTAALPWGLLAAPTALTANSASTSGTTELDLALDQTVTITSTRRVTLTFTPRNLLGTVQQDLFEVRFRENGTQVMAFRGQVHEVTAHIDMHTMTHTYTPTSGSRTFDVTLIRVAGTGTAQIIAGATFPATFTVMDPGVP